MNKTKFYGGVEAGGTKFVCGVGSGGGELLARKEIKTTTPEETLARVYEFFEAQKTVERIGVGSFGPLDLNDQSKNYGAILETTKEGWKGVNIPKLLKEKLDKPAGIVTDTDVAAIGELYFGKATGKKNFVYLTVGTGIGGSIMFNSELVHGISHPEIGHIRVPHNLSADPFAGSCQYHGDCFEGLASGQALKTRSGVGAKEISDGSIWEQEAKYLAYGLVSIIAMVQPELIIMGGSVMKHAGLIERVRELVGEDVNHYFHLPRMDRYIVRASSDTIGVLGAIKLASLN